MSSHAGVLTKLLLLSCYINDVTYIEAQCPLPQSLYPVQVNKRWERMNGRLRLRRKILNKAVAQGGKKNLNLAQKPLK